MLVIQVRNGINEPLTTHFFNCAHTMNKTKKLHIFFLEHRDTHTKKKTTRTRIHTDFGLVRVPRSKGVFQLNGRQRKTKKKEGNQVKYLDKHIFSLSLCFYLWLSRKKERKKKNKWPAGKYCNK